MDELVNKKHEGGGVIYGLRVVKLIEYTRDERKAILYLTKKIDAYGVRHEQKWWH